MAGISWPKEMIPEAWRYLSYLIPYTWGAHAFIHINSMGASLALCSREYIALWILAAVYFALACGLFYLRKRSNEVKELIKEPFFKDIHPYNGTLIKRSIIEKIGLIKKEMFIWGDEKEYMARAFHNGIGLYTLTSAIHYHPKEKGTFGSILPFIPSPKILLKPQKMSRFYYRNEGFIYEHYPEKKSKMWLFECAYIIRFLTHFEFRELAKFIKYFNRGRKNDYSE
jgi:GT2 family glycosyltransferase